MPTLGEELRRRREERAISLNDISEATRIGTRFLKAIESDNFSILPGGIFTRSFIRAFAKQVGMNEDEALGLYQQQVGTQGVEAPAAASGTAAAERPRTTAAPIETPRVRRSEPLTYRQTGPSLNWSTIIIAAGIILIVGLSILALVKRLNRPSEADQQQPAAAQTSPQTPTQQPQQAQPEAQQPAAQAPPQTPAVTPGQALAVTIAATDDQCWVRFNVDGQKQTDVTLKPGESRELPPAQSEVKIKIGNTHKFKFTINGREAYLPPGTKEFGPEISISRDNAQNYLQPPPQVSGEPSGASR